MFDVKCPRHHNDLRRLVHHRGASALLHLLDEWPMLR
jgi:hypothetical protein